MEGRTIRAQPDTLGYRTSTFIRRNRLAVAGVAVGVIALIGGTVISARQASVARTERDRARVEQARTTRVSEFFQRVLSQAEPREGGRAVTVTDALSRAIPIVDTAFVTEPDLKAAVQLSIGSTLQNLQENERARPLLQAAYDWFRTHEGASPSRNQTDAMWNLATLATSDGRPAEAESLYARLAVLYRGSEYGANDALAAQLRIAGLRVDKGDLIGAVAAYDSLIPKRILKTRTDSLDHAASIGSRGSALATLGKFDRAERDLAQAREINERLLGPESFATADLLQPYAGTLLFTGKLIAAESIARRSFVISTKAYGDTAQRTVAAARILGTILVAADRCDDAIRTFSGILALRGPNLPDSDPSIGYALAYRGFCRARRGDARGGVADARDGLRLVRRIFGDKHYMTHLAESLTGAALGFGPPSSAAEAEQLLAAGATGLRATLDPAHPRVTDAEKRLQEFRTRARASTVTAPH
jgi:serine/threonine-protein kinase